MKRTKKGSVLLITAVFSLITSLVLGSLFAFQLQYHKINNQNLDRTFAIYHAESAEQLALYELRHKTTAERWGSNGTHGTYATDGTDWTIDTGTNPDTYTYTDTDGTEYSSEIEGL